MTWRLRLLTLAALTSLAAATGCGGGGGGGGATGPAGTTPTPQPQAQTGQVNLSVNFPARTGRSAQAVQSSGLPAAAVKVVIDIHTLVNGVASTLPAATVTLDRPSDAGGEVSKIIVMQVGRYIARLASRDSSGNVLTSGVEPIKIEAFTITRVPTVLGVIYNPTTGFIPSNLTLKTGETLMLRNEGNLPVTLSVSGSGGCSAQLERTGALACTLRTSGTFTITDGAGRQAILIVEPDSALLAQATPSLGVVRAEGLALSTSVFTAQFLINNGGAALPDGLRLDPGNGQASVPITSNTISATYGQGSFIAKLVDAAGTTLSQRYVAVFEPALSIPGAVTLASVPSTVSTSTLTFEGTAGAGQTVILKRDGEVLQTVTTSSTGAFSFTVTLTQGTNLFQVSALSGEGLPGPATSLPVAYVPSAGGGVLASIVITGVPSTATAGQGISFSFQGLDANGQPVTFTPTLSNSGVTGSFQGNNLFTPVTTGTGTIRVTGPGNITGLAAFTVNPGTLASIRVTPGNLTARVGQAYTLSAVGYDGLGNAITSGLTFTWAVTGLSGLNASTGVITPPSSGFGVVTAASGAVTGTTCMSAGTVQTL